MTLTTARILIAFFFGITMGAFLTDWKCESPCCSSERLGRYARETFKTWAQGWHAATFPPRYMAVTVDEVNAISFAAQYMERFIDQTLDELHGAALWIDELRRH